MHSMSNTHGAEDEDDDEVINPMYEGGDNVHDRTNKTQALYSQPHKKDAAIVSSEIGDVYAVVRKKTKGKKGTGKTSTPKENNKDCEDVYENAENPRGVKDRNTSHAIETEICDVPLAKTPTKRSVNKEGLIYADLEFPDPPKGQRRLVVHGLDDMTEYASVDLTKKAEPLPESDEDESKLPSK